MEKRLGDEANVQTIFFFKSIELSIPMPYPAQISKEIVVAEARRIIESDGVEQLSLAKLASALGVKAPSLYRHVKNKAQLLEEVAFLTFQLLIEAMSKVDASSPDSPADVLLSKCIAFRHFAHSNPRTYILANTAANRGDEEQLVQLVLPFQRTVSTIAGEANSLPMLRGLLALIHGFVMLELHNQLRRGGDLNQTFDQVVRAYIIGWQQS